MPGPYFPDKKNSPLVGLIFFALLIALTVIALSVFEPASRQQVTTGKDAVISAPPVESPKVVALAPHLAELVYTAGAGAHLQAVTRYSDFLPAIKSLPVVGDAFALDYEKLLQMQPEVVLAWDGGTPEPVLRKLKRIGLNVEAISIQNLADIGQAIRRIGHLLGSSSIANRQADFFEQELASRQQNMPRMPVQRAFIQISDKPLYTVSGTHWISQAVALCGLHNVFADMDLVSAPVTEESVVKRQPEVILILSKGEETATAGQSAVSVMDANKTLWRAWQDMPAVKNQRVLHVDADRLSRPTPRILSTVSALCEVLRLGE